MKSQRGIDMFTVSMQIGDTERFEMHMECVEGIDNRPWKLEKIAKEPGNHMESNITAFLDEFKRLALKAYREKYGTP